MVSGNASQCVTKTWFKTVDGFKSVKNFVSNEAIDISSDPDTTNKNPVTNQPSDGKINNSRQGTPPNSDAKSVPKKPETIKKRVDNVQVVLDKQADLYTTPDAEAGRNAFVKQVDGMIESSTGSGERAKFTQLRDDVKGGQDVRIKDLKEDRSSGNIFNTRISPIWATIDTSAISILLANALSALLSSLEINPAIKNI